MMSTTICILLTFLLLRESSPERLGRQTSDQSTTGTVEDSQVMKDLHPKEYGEPPDSCIDICQLFDPCDSNHTCRMTPDCTQAVCVNLTATATATNSSANGTTLMTAETESCQHLHHLCIRGRCEDSQCVCEEGWTGLLCEFPCNLPCLHGSCVLIEGEALCYCDSQYSGHKCDRLTGGATSTFYDSGVFIDCSRTKGKLSFVMLLLALHLILRRTFSN